MPASFDGTNLRDAGPAYAAPTIEAAMVETFYPGAGGLTRYQHLGNRAAALQLKAICTSAEYFALLAKIGRRGNLVRPPYSTQPYVLLSVAGDSQVDRKTGVEYWFVTLSLKLAQSS